MNLFWIFFAASLARVSPFGNLQLNSSFVCSLNNNLLFCQDSKLSVGSAHQGYSQAGSVTNIFNIRLTPEELRDLASSVQSQPGGTVTILVRI